LDLKRPEKFALPCNPTIYLHLAYAVGIGIAAIIENGML
jgi:hypothetical protein